MCLLNSLLSPFILRLLSHILNLRPSYTSSSPKSLIPGYNTPFSTPPLSQGKAMGPQLPTTQNLQQ